MDEHEWLDGAEPLSEPPTDMNGVVLEYFSRDKPAFRALQKLVMDRNWLKSLKYYTRFRYIVKTVVVMLRMHVVNLPYAGILDYWSLSIIILP